MFITNCVCRIISLRRIKKICNIFRIHGGAYAGSVDLEISKFQLDIQFLTENLNRNYFKETGVGMIFELIVTVGFFLEITIIGVGIYLVHRDKKNRKPIRLTCIAADPLECEVLFENGDREWVQIRKFRNDERLYNLLKFSWKSTVTICPEYFDIEMTANMFNELGIDVSTINDCILEQFGINKTFFCIQPIVNDNETNCVICLDIPPEIRFNCGHQICCSKCSKRINNCPKCRTFLFMKKKISK